MEEPSPESRQAILAALEHGRRIEAIKLYRESTGCDLATAVEFIDKLSAQLRKEDPERFAATAQAPGCLTVLLAGIFIAGTVALLT